MDMTIEEARGLVGDTALWPLMRDFLWDFAPQVHPSWLEGLLPPGVPASSPRAKAHVLSELGVSPCFHTFPKDDWSRLLLLDGGTLESLAQWLGALAFADSLRRVTGGVAVRALRAALAGVYPEVFGYTAYFRLKTDGLKAEGAGEIVSAGRAMLKSYVAGLPEPLLRRLALKLPKGSADELPSALPASGLPALNLRLLLKLRFPEVHSLCC